MSSTDPTPPISTLELTEPSSLHKQPSTSSHPLPTSPDPTTAQAASAHHGCGHAARRLTAPSASSAAQLSSLALKLRSALRQFPDFPSPGILFEDIMPLFADPALHADLVRALELHVTSSLGEKPDVVVGLEARGFIFGPSLALKLGAGFVPVRKKGKLPGPTVQASYQKEYGVDLFEMQDDGVKEGQKVLIVDDIIATGGSAAAAGSLVKQLGGNLLGYVFIMELDFLKGRERLDAPVYTLFAGQEKSLKETS